VCVVCGCGCVWEREWVSECVCVCVRVKLVLDPVSSSCAVCAYGRISLCA